MSQPTKREWIAAANNRWERRDTRQEAIKALKKRVRMGHNTRIRAMYVAEVPAGAYVDAMGGICWKYPDNWDNMSPEEQREYGRIESEMIPG